jgi:prepilin-type processing-associated H-X9-DG protein
MRRCLILSLFIALELAAAPGCKKSKPTQSDDASSDHAPAPVAGPKGGQSSGGQSSGTLSFAVQPIYPTSNSQLRQTSSNNLKQIGLAWMNFHDVMQGYPEGIYDKSGKKLGLSWRVAILPYIEQQKLYAQFKLDEPWDSENNKKLISQMPRTYAPPGGGGKPGFTYYRCASGPGTILPPVPGGKPGQPAVGVKMFQIPDGTSNTITAFEAGEPVEWTRPDELEFVPGKPLPMICGVFGDGMNVLFADGSARFIKKTDFTPDVLKAMITTNGGEVVQLP